MRLPERKWWICGLLLLATMINYMDRVTLANAAGRITKEFHLSEQQYGNLELGFGLAFAAGSLLFGFVAERANLRWLYPLVLFGWSMAGAASAWTHDFGGLMICRIVLGFFEAGHWPCALKTTFALLQPGERTLGNSVLQSGASLGAIITPQLMKWMMTDDVGSWRFTFQAIAFVGLGWIALWLACVRSDELKPREAVRTGAALPIGAIIRKPKFWAILLLITGVQIPWHIIRAWLPKFLQTGRGYTEAEALDFNSLYYIATDVGCLMAGFVALWLVKKYAMSAHKARRRVYQVASVITATSLLIPWLGRGWGLLALLLLIGAASLALFPCFYSFTQELSDDHVGRLTGLFSTWGWVMVAPVQSLFGWLADRTHSYDLGMACAGLAPLLGVLSLAIWWKEEPEPKEPAVA